MNTHRRARAERAFTLIELMVVIAIFLILIAIAVPAFASMLYSSEQSLAENSLRIALSSARDAAARSPQGQDAVAAFTYDPVTHHTQCVTCVYAGVLKAGGGIVGSGGSSAASGDTEVFATQAGTQPVQFPRGWSIRGYAPADTIDDAWYEKTYTGSARDRGNWVFPETGFYNEDQGRDGGDRQTFVVRFEGGTGIAKYADTTPVLVLLPSPSVVFRNASPWLAYRADTAPDPVRFVKRVLASPVLGSGSQRNRQDLLGDAASDTVLAKPVAQIAVYNEKRLLQALNRRRAQSSLSSLRLDPSTECLYIDPTRSPAVYQPQLLAGMSDQDLVWINDWIEGHLQDQTTPSELIESDCRVFVVQRYLGTLQEVTGSAGGQGVGQ